jgi:hypothetical protein
MASVATAWTASASAYHTGSSRRAGQVRRAHLIPPTGTFPRRGAPTAACGTPWWDTRNAENERLPLGGPLPPELTWCPKCLGVAAEVLGLSARVATLIAQAAA